MKQTTFKFALLFVFALIGLTACVDDDYDAPPINGIDPDIDANMTIADLKAMHTIGAYEEISDDIIITGIVISDDRSGNFYKSITIQDSTGGIELRMDETELFNEYGEGRRLYIKCNGLWLADYNGTTQIGAAKGVDDSGRDELVMIPSALFDEHIIKGQWNFEVEPKVRTINQLREGDISTLVKLENVQFALESCVRTYAIDYTTDEGTRVQQSLNQNLESCSNPGNVIVVRSSGFASFAGQMLPIGSGSITAVYTVFGDTKQLVIRDTDDTDMTGDRCGNSGVDGDLKTIKEVRDLFTGSPLSITNSYKISGTVISDRDNGNTNNRNLVIQDETAGIVVRFDQAHNIGLGEIVEINISNTELSEFNGLLQVMNTPNEQAFSTCEIGNITPRVVTVQELLNNVEEWESTLVKIDEATISGSATFAGDNFVTDATNSIDLYTSSDYATFANDLVPSGNLEVTAILSYNNGAQIYMRNRDDVVGGEIIEPELTDISTIRASYAGSTMTITDNYEIKGVVISDVDNGNIHEQNLVLQDGSAGIVIRFSESHDFVLGDELTITVKGQELSEYQTLLQINNLPLAAVTEVAVGTLPDPRIATVKEILDNGEEWESTLVQVKDVSISGSSTYNGNTTVSDNSGSIAMFTRSQASFANVSVPSGSVTLTGYVSEFGGTRQLGIRNLNDVE